MTPSRQMLELQLNDFDPTMRRAALEGLWDLARLGHIELPEPGRWVNLHCHTFYSFNGYGYSPSAVAWEARVAGLGAVGLVDFDVLDGVEEFLEACRLLGLRGCAGLETRIYVPEFGSREINSPGEPGVAYFMGSGFVTSTLADSGLLPSLRETARARTRRMVELVNPYLSPVVLNFDADVLSLTPNGNATERHVCIAYDRKSRELMPDDGVRAEFWARKLDTKPGEIAKLFADPPLFQGHIRAKLMKAGGIGYIKPTGADFPELNEVARFTVDAQSIPTYAWLDGTTQGEQDIDELLDLMMSKGVSAVNLIPDRNWNIKDPVARETKIALMHRFVEKAQGFSLPILVGTEMNAYGQRFVDDFDAEPMQVLRGPAWEGALILHGHTQLQRWHGMGYMSEWSMTRFSNRAERNTFYRRVGELAAPTLADASHVIGPEMQPGFVLTSLQGLRALH